MDKYYILLSMRKYKLEFILVSFRLKNDLKRKYIFFLI